MVEKNCKWVGKGEAVEKWRTSDGKGGGKKVKLQNMFIFIKAEWRREDNKRQEEINGDGGKSSKMEIVTP